MQTVKEVSKQSGVSVRALHHYDAIGLLKPTKITEAGYRLYDRAAMKRLQNILMFRELEFSLKEIKSILNNPIFDANKALEQQIKLLELRRKHIEELIVYARKIQKEGVDIMDFKAFHKEEMEQYAEEVREKWGATKAYEEYMENINGRTDIEMKKAAEKMRLLFAEIGRFRKGMPDEQNVQDKIRELQALITERYYHCTDEILYGLGKLYVADVRMKDNIDQAGGDGTAEFVEQAILIYCKNRGMALS